MRILTFDPIEKISELLEHNGYGKNLRVGHISYDKKVNDNYDYQIIRSQGHDGLLYLTQKTIDNTLLPLINRTTYGTNTINEEDLKRVKEIHYVIGDIRLETKYGKINSAGAGKIPGQTDTVYIPVRCEYIFK